MAWIVVSGGRKDVNLRLCGMIETSGRRRGDIMEKDEQESFNQAGEPLFFECECDLVGNPKLKNDLKMARLKNRIAIITGAGQGIGRAIALGYAREGAKVVIADINEESARIVKNEIETSGGTALAIRTDVSIELSVRAMVDHSLRDFGRLDILVNNAGIFPTSSVEEMGEEEWDRVIGTNLVGVFLCTRAVVSNFIKQAAGRIISITSGRAFQGAKNAAHYAASGILCVKQVG
jgi:NADP-dependent 3-hydroxy acid dehydrogenase YdfG